MHSTAPQLLHAQRTVRRARWIERAERETATQRYADLFPGVKNDGIDLSYNHIECWIPLPLSLFRALSLSPSKLFFSFSANLSPALSLPLSVSFRSTALAFLSLRRRSSLFQCQPSLAERPITIRSVLDNTKANLNEPSRRFSASVLTVCYVP